MSTIHDIVKTVRTITEATGDPLKSQAAVEYLRALYDYDEALNRGNDGRRTRAAQIKLDAAKVKLKGAFKAVASRVMEMLDTIENQLYTGRTVRDTLAAVQARDTYGFDEATWVKLMSKEWDNYEPYEAPASKTSRLGDDEGSQIWNGGTELMKGLRALQANPRKKDSMSKQDLMRLRAIGKMLKELGFA